MLGRYSLAAIARGIWSNSFIALASRTVTLPAGTYSIRASSYQRGTMTLNSSASGSATISSVTLTRAQETLSGFDSNYVGDDNGIILHRMALTGATTIAGSRQVAGGNNTTLAFTVVEDF